jgi:Tol biopolymer transport system component
MSPEQARGQAVDKRADIWAFGCVLFEMLTGRTPFPGSTVSDHIAAILEREPDWTALPPATPARIRRLLRRCLEKDLNRRLHDIADARIEIDDAREADGVVRTEPLVTSARDRAWWTAIAAAAAIAVIAIGFTSWSVLRPAPPAAPIAFTFTLPPPPEGQRALTISGSLSVSPDGQSVAFVALDENRRSTEGETGQPVLFIRALGLQDARMLSGTDGATNPFWSPDGRFVGFVAGGTLKKIAAAGGPPVTLADHTGRSAAWSARGVILFHRGDQGPLLQISDSGGQPTPVTTLDPSRDELVHDHPLFLPDGRRFVFLARCNDRSKNAIYLASLDSDTRTRLLDVNSQPDYSAGFLLYERGGTVMAQPFDEQRERLTGEAIPIAHGVDTQTFDGRAAFSVSANGVLIYRTGPATGGPGRLTWFDRSGKALGTIAEKGFYRYPRVSPDGRRVAVTFSRDPSWAAADLWQIDLDRPVPTRFTFHPDDDFWPNVWSPDGQRVVFSSSRTRKGVFDLYQRSAAGAATDELLWQSSDNKSASGFSPDGRLLMVERYMGPGKGRDVWALPTTGDRKPFPLIATPFNEDSAVVSPSGRFIAYVSDDSGPRQVYVQPFPPTGARVRLSSGSGFSPVWTADGRTVLYSTSDQRFMAVDVATSGSTVRAGSPRMLFTQRHLGGGANGFTVDPSGQRFLLVVPDQQAFSPITVVVNWPSLLAKK